MILNMGVADDRGRNWALLTGHGHVLVEIAKNPDARIRDNGLRIGPMLDLLTAMAGADEPHPAARPPQRWRIGRAAMGRNATGQARRRAAAPALALADRFDYLAR